MLAMAKDSPAMLTIIDEAIHACPVCTLVAMQTNVGYQVTAATTQMTVVDHSRRRQTPTAAIKLPPTINTKSASQKDNSEPAGQSLG